MKISIRTILLPLLFAAGAASANCDYDDFPVMDSMRVEIVMDNANYNNRPMMVRSYFADASYEEVVDYYHDRWRDRYDDTAFGIWHQVTTLTDECMMTVQVTPQSDSTSRGRLLISNPPSGNPRAPLGEGVIAPAESVVVSDLRTRDGRRHGRVTMLTSSLSTSEVVEYYLSEMRSNGWSLQRRFREGLHGVLVFRKGLDVSNIAIAPAGEMTQILINGVDFR